MSIEKSIEICAPAASVWDAGMERWTTACPDEPEITETSTFERQVTLPLPRLFRSSFGKIAMLRTAVDEFVPQKLMTVHGNLGKIASFHARLELKQLTHYTKTRLLINFIALTPTPTILDKTLDGLVCEELTDLRRKAEDMAFRRAS